MSEPETDLSALLAELERLTVGDPNRNADAIDDTLQSPRRVTQTQSVRRHGAIEDFRRELTDGLIRADTAN
ncbi:MAG: hypothetical protein JSU68_04375, partial [Phycisphaerales bacterium]